MKFVPHTTQPSPYSSIAFARSLGSLSYCLVNFLWGSFGFVVSPSSSLSSSVCCGFCSSSKKERAVFFSIISKAFSPMLISSSSLSGKEVSFFQQEKSCWRSTSSRFMRILFIVLESIPRVGGGRSFLEGHLILTVYLTAKTPNSCKKQDDLISSVYPGPTYPCLSFW